MKTKNYKIINILYTSELKSIINLKNKTLSIIKMEIYT